MTEDLLHCQYTEPHDIVDSVNGHALVDAGPTQYTGSHVNGGHAANGSVDTRQDYYCPSSSVLLNEDIPFETPSAVGEPEVMTYTHDDAESTQYVSELLNGHITSNPYASFNGGGIGNGSTGASLANFCGSVAGAASTPNGGGCSSSTMYSSPRSEEVTACCIDLVLVQFLCPALVDPEPHGVCDAPVSPVARFNLMQVGLV